MSEIFAILNFNPSHMLKYLLDNPEKTLKGKIRNILLIFIIEMFWLAGIQIFLKTLFPNGVDRYPKELAPGVAATFFFGCIWAPLWEELAFRFAPITLAKHFGKEVIMPVIVLSSVLFGWGHGYGPISLLIQGVGGFLFSILYIKNNFSYWSTVTAHFLWNFTLIFVIPLLFGS